MLVLVAEDNVDNREMLVRRLRRKGYDVIEAVDGVEAVELTETFSPLVVLMDVSMPVRNGLEATQMIRRNCAGGGPKIIALTAHAMSSARQECMNAGCDAFATKPVDFPALIALMTALTGSAPQSGSAA
jgi:CheY-like chemotaxis protein